MIHAANPTHVPTSAPALPTPDRAAARTASVLLASQFVAMWAAFAILAPTINWPASLDEPPSVILPLILDQSTAVFLGYFSYMVHALLLNPSAVILPAALGMSQMQGWASLILGSFAGFAKALGIARWLFLMPGLAAAYTTGSTSEATQSAIAVGL